VAIELLTGVDRCYAGGESGIRGMLLADPTYGASINGMPVMWPVGFTGVRVGGEIGVLDSAGKAVATTGKVYYMSRGPVSSEDKRLLMESIGAFPAAANCGYPWDFIDCTAAALATGEPIDANGMYTALGEAALHCGSPQPSTTATL
jgi:hypothetical protein